MREVSRGPAAAPPAELPGTAASDAGGTSPKLLRVGQSGLLEEPAQVSEVLGEGVLSPAPWLLPWPRPGSAAPWLPTLLPSCCGMWRAGSSGLGLGPGQPGRRGWRSEEVEALLYTRNWMEIWRGRVKASLMEQRLGGGLPLGPVAPSRAAPLFPSRPPRPVCLLHFPV